MKNLSRSWRAVSALGLALLAAPLTSGEAKATVFFAGEFNEKGDFVPNAKVKGPCYNTKFCTVSASIESRWARTKLVLDVEGPGESSPLSTVCVVPLPKSVVSGKDVVFRAEWADKKERQPLVTRFLEAGEAQSVYEAIAKATGAPSVMALSGGPALLVLNFPLEKSQKIEIELQQPLVERQGLLSYECPLPSTGFTWGPVKQLSLTVSLRDKEPLRSVFSPTHGISVERDGFNEARVSMTASDWSGANVFRLFYVADAEPLGLRVVTYREPGEDAGYFMILGNPTGNPTDKVIEKDVIFALDTSGSMRGEKMEQACSAIEYCLKNLNPGDRFNVITFGTEVKSFRDELASNTADNLRAALEFVENIVAVGRTNISGALEKGLAGKPTKGRPRIMIFLTDGTPTEGERVAENIIKKLPAMNTSQTQVFVMGVGYDVNVHLLDLIAEETEGSSEYVLPHEDIDVRVAALYKRLSNPFLQQVQASFGELRTSAVYPKKLRALFKGNEISICGRYRGSGTHKVTISGILAGEPKEYTCEVAFPGEAATENEFVASTWATRAIGFLLQEIRLHGENDELVKEVIRLSEKFGIVTEYTAFIAMAGAKMDADRKVKEAQKRLSEARAEKAGKWAVLQAQEEKQQQQQGQQSQQGQPAPRPAAPQEYLDRRGNVQRAENVRQIGGRAFYLRKDHWEDAEDDSNRKIRTVKLWSPEYFELVRTNARFREAQALGGNIIINIGDERIVVEK